jgi:hypothetical protein
MRMGVVAYLDSEEPNNIGLQTGIYLPHSCLRILENILIKNRTTLTNAFALVAPYYKSYIKKVVRIPGAKEEDRNPTHLRGTTPRGNSSQTPAPLHLPPNTISMRSQTCITY